ncbi:MAG: CPBP family intramembrane metalloprotease [Phycisphaerales bacterium]|nr:CPBP family intramembrane metalloprotease [Phycisphaerales bacterium]
MRTTSSSGDGSRNVKIGLVGITIVVVILHFALSEFIGAASGIGAWINQQISPDQTGLFLWHVLAYWTAIGALLYGVVAFGVFRCSARQVFLLPGRSAWSIQKALVITLLVAVCEVAIILGTRWGNLEYALYPGDMVGNLISNAYEEIWFRGFMLGMLIRFSGRPWYAILLTSLFFTLGHTQYVGWISVGFFVLAIPFAWITWKTQWILWAYILHNLVDWAVDPFLTPGHVSDLLAGG